MAIGIEACVFLNQVALPGLCMRGDQATCRTMDNCPQHPLRRIIRVMASHIPGCRADALHFRPILEVVEKDWLTATASRQKPWALVLAAT